MRTIVGLFDDRSHASQAQNEIVTLGIPREQTWLFEQETTTGGRQDVRERSWWDQIKEALGFQFTEEEATYYREGVQRGGTLLSVRAHDGVQDRIIEIMNRHGAVDIDRRAAEWKSAGWAPEAGEARVPVVEEELRLGKREVQRGGVRVYSHVTEMPVEEEIPLREEHVEVHRRPVDRPVAPGEAVFQEEAVEMAETHEEPVVSKSARVKEEVVVKKEATERSETVRDSVRRKDVEVEETDQPNRGIGSSRKAG